ncbi:MAG: FecR family protein [Gammaproteobacteria bacterium]|nr:FecR family protein [Gammaproteobacteria bacterium]
MAQKIGLIMPVFILVFLIQSGLCHAEEARGTILKTSGVVKIINAQGETREATGANVVIHEMDTVSTSEGGQAVVRFNDGALSVLDEKSSLQVEKKNWLSHLGGKIYFTFRKVFGDNRQVKAKFSTIGIRGTTFIVTDNQDAQSVSLQEGQLVLESPGDDYEIHRKKPVDDFAAFKQQAIDAQNAMKKEYEDYKKQTMVEFVEYKKSFTLQANHMIRFDGNRVDETEMGEKEQESFSNFESVAGEMLETFRQQSKDYREQQENNPDDGKADLKNEKRKKNWRNIFD